MKRIAIAMIMLTLAVSLASCFTAEDFAPDEQKDLRKRGEPCTSDEQCYEESTLCIDGVCQSDAALLFR